MNLEFRTALSQALAIAVMAFVVFSGVEVSAETKTVTFGWEDGTSTATIDVNGDATNDLPPVAISPDTASVAVANVTTGVQTFFGPSGAPFEEPVLYDVAPLSGSRMLEVAVTPMTIDTGTDAVVYLGLISGLSPGDTYSYKFNTYEKTPGTSPSSPANATYTDTNPSFITFNTAFAVPLQPFVDGDGWVETALDANGSTAGVITDVVYSPITGGDYSSNNIVDAADYTVFRDHLGQTFTLPNERATPNGSVTEADYSAWKTRFGQSTNAVRLEANFFYQSLSQMNAAVEYFYLDDLEITVNSANPEARIFLPDGTSVLVNPPLDGVGAGAVPEPTSLLLLAVGVAGALVGRRSRL